MKQNKLPLPVDSFLPDILDAVRSYSTVMVKASPGSGKTTRLPWAIAKETGKRVVVLEPRRLAARLAAQRIADEEELTLGKEVGFHFRFEKNATENTLLTFYTEGTFLKKFLSGDELTKIDVVILDEFHERHLETDLALALLRSWQQKHDLKIVLMSATLDMKLAEYFPDAKAIEIEAPLHPVEIHYLPNQPSVLHQALEVKVKKTIDVTSGDTLVFLPGMREMLRTKEHLQGDFEVFLLHADLSKEEQARALTLSKKRKIILATNIAESSLTIPGVKVVIDSGIQREAHYSPWNGLKFTKDTPVTKSSAIQRAGRAGRTGPGECHRLYSQQDFNEREEYTIPEIKRADLTDVCLLVTGTHLMPSWFEPPHQEKWNKAIELLNKLNAMKGKELTPMGQKMLHFPLDSRLSRALLEGENLRRQEKEKLLNYITFEIEEDRNGTLRKRLNFYLSQDGSDQFPWEKCLLTGFIDQVAKYRSKQKDFIHYSGKTLKAHASLSQLQDGFYLIFDITQRQEAIKVLEIEEEWLWDIVPFPFSEDEEVSVNEKISIRRKTKLGSIVMEESALAPSWTDLSDSLKEKVLRLSLQKMNQEIEKFKNTRWYEKALFWTSQKGLNADDPFADLNLSVFFQNQITLGFENFDFYLRTFLEEKFDLQGFEAELPDKVNFGGRREIEVHYPSGMAPYIEAPIQDFYGLDETPSIMRGKVPLTLKLLGPHKRPIQITKDLKNFWRKTYQEMKKEYGRDYPRHYWPDKPWEAKPFLLKSHLPKA
ncbi:MAG: ATP-dependent helicase C-terminal domain-containing protein [Bacteriovoracia bacterium]